MAVEEAGHAQEIVDLEDGDDGHDGGCQHGEHEAGPDLGRRADAETEDRVEEEVFAQNDAVEDVVRIQRQAAGEADQRRQDGAGKDQKA